MSETQAQSQRLRELIFVRELNEVFLLLDFISGRSDKRIRKDKAQAEDEKQQETWLARLCSIGLGAPERTMLTAEDAAQLLLTKDKLNEKAHPATGATVAFTSMVVGEDAQAMRCRRATDATVPTSPEAGGPMVAPTRVSMACRAFPGLVARACQFRRRAAALIILLCLWLMVTCVVSWYVTAGNMVLTDLDANHAHLEDIRHQMYAVQRVLGKSKVIPDEEGGRQASNVACDGQSPCLQFASVSLPGAVPEEPGYVLVEANQLLTAWADGQHRHEALVANVRGWLDFIPTYKVVTSAPKDPDKKEVMLKTDDPHEQARESLEEKQDEAAMRVFEAVLATAVLPLFYGVLGAGVAVMRDLWHKVRESLLEPRDLSLAAWNMALGAIIGTTIGLLTSYQPGNGQHETVLGSIALTGSAIAFLAGFGVEVVIAALETTVQRVFSRSTARPAV